MGYVPQVMSPLTTNSLLAVRQQIDKSNYDMLNILTQQIGSVFNPLIPNTNDRYQQLAHQMDRIVYFFGTPQAHIRPIPQIKC